MPGAPPPTGATMAVLPVWLTTVPTTPRGPNTGEPSGGTLGCGGGAGASETGPGDGEIGGTAASPGPSGSPRADAAGSLLPHGEGVGGAWPAQSFCCSF